MDRQTYIAIQEFGRRLAAKYDVRGLVLFGSRARGDFNEDSDADVMVLLQDLPNGFQTMLDLSDVAYYVGLDTGIIISPLPVTLEEWDHPEEYSNPSLLKAIAREGVPVPMPRLASATA